MQHGVALTLTDIHVAFTIFIKCCTYLENLAIFFSIHLFQLILKLFHRQVQKRYSCLCSQYRHWNRHTLSVFYTGTFYTALQKSHWIPFIMCVPMQLYGAVFFATFMQNIEPQIKSSSVMNALKQAFLGRHITYKVVKWCIV